VRNHRDQPQRHQVALRLPSGITATPSVLEGVIPAKSRQTYQVRLTADSDRVAAGLLMVPFDITLDGHRYGEWFDFLLLAKPE
jgi:uncharacterized heparinase superfamily protein